MTDAENQRQRHLANLAIAQCDGKIIQFHNDTGWIDAKISLLALIRPEGASQREWRIKPEPREWWICEKCNTSLDERFAAHPSRDGKTFCEGKQADLRKSREVLEP